MRTDVSRLAAASFGCLVATFVGAGDTEIPTTSTAGASASRLMSVVNVIEQHHIDPPPKQELIRRLVQRFAVRWNIEPPTGLGRRLSEVSTDAALARELRELCADMLADTKSDDEEILRSVEELAIGDLLSSLQGFNRLTTKKEHHVQQQFAGNRYVGTGIALRYDGVPIMAHVFPQGPAARVGARDGDRILQIDGESTDNVSLKNTVDLLRGPEGSDVEVVLQQPDGSEPRRLTITRGVVPFKHTRMERQGTEAVIKFDQITAATVQDLREIEAGLPDEIDEVTLDWQSLREWNQHHGVILADALLDGGEVGRVRTAGGVRMISATREMLFRNRDLAVMVSNVTAGTLEWVAAALQDQQRAKIIGQRTAGRPFVTTSLDVPGTNWILVLTTGLLERADGTPLIASGAASAMASRFGNGMPVLSARPVPVGKQQRSAPQRNGGVEPDVEQAPHADPVFVPPMKKTDPKPVEIIEWIRRFLEPVP